MDISYISSDIDSIIDKLNIAFQKTYTLNIDTSTALSSINDVSTSIGLLQSQLDDLSANEISINIKSSTDTSKDTFSNIFDFMSKVNTISEFATNISTNLG